MATLLQTLDDPTPTVGDNILFTVALSGDRVLIGTVNNVPEVGVPGQGQLFDARTGTLLATFGNPSASADDDFGVSIALSGNRVLIGAPDDNTAGFGVGRAYLFDATTGELLHIIDDPTPTDNDGFGRSVALEGDRVLISDRGDDTQGEGVGQVHLFDATDGKRLQTFDDPTATSFNGFGASIAISGDLVLIGAPGDALDPLGPVGQAHLFDAATGALRQTFNDPELTSLDGFGLSVALSGDRVLIGEANELLLGLSYTQPVDESLLPVGQAHLFDADTGALQRTFDDPTPTDRDLFGFSVALDGDRVLIGAPFDDTQGTNVGQAHLFDAVTGALLQTFDDPTPTDVDDPTPTGFDAFAVSVALSGDRVLIGGSFDSTQGGPDWAGKSVRYC